MVETTNGIFIYYRFLVILLDGNGENTMYVIIFTEVSGEIISTPVPFSRVVLNCETITVFSFNIYICGLLMELSSRLEKMP